jgi:hypothetical protein
MDPLVDQDQVERDGIQMMQFKSPSSPSKKYKSSTIVGMPTGSTSGRNEYKMPNSGFKLKISDK